MANLDSAVEYTRTRDGLNIAYVTAGSGPLFLILPNLPISSIGLDWGLANGLSARRQLAQRWRVARYDCRGAGLSDRDVATLSFESYLQDLEAVIDKTGAGRVALFAQLNSGPLAIHFAAHNPDRVSHLILEHSFSRYADFLGLPRMRLINQIAACDWRLFSRVIAHMAVEWEDPVEAIRQARLIEDSMTPALFEQAIGVLAGIDVTPLLPQIRCPTLIIHNRNASLIDAEVSRHLAGQIEDAKLVMLDGPVTSESQELVALINSFAGEHEAPFSAPPFVLQYAPTQTNLSNRELAVLGDLASGLKSKEIAAKLGISVHTVDRHIANIYQKTGARSRAAVASYAVKRGIVRDQF